MATGNYGIVRPSDININDLDVFYTFTENRTVVDVNVKKLNPAQVLRQKQHPDYTNRVLGGLYDLTLPSSIFNKKGIYTVYIRPREINVRIIDCGVLATDTSRRGIILNLSEISAGDVSKFENNSLIGYRVEYLAQDSSGGEQKIRNLHRIVTSNFRVEPLADNLNSTTQKTIRYRANDNSSFVFCTLVPSTAPSTRPNLVPFIGAAGQNIILTNTYCDPLAIEINLVEHDFDTLALGLFGDRAREQTSGVITIYDQNGNIYKQFREGVAENPQTVGTLYDMRVELTNIDLTQNIDNLNFK